MIPAARRRALRAWRSQVVIDQIANAYLYLALGSRIGRALEFLRHTDLASLEPGRHELDGDRIYALVSEYVSKRPDYDRWEAHRRYIDLQCLASGTERIGYAPADRLDPGTYDDARDMLRLSGPGEFLTLRPGDFMLLWPGDAHMPGVAVDEPSPVKKVVVKIQLGER
jgi:YhcH/YjgK/YiaL family protein